MKKVKIMLSSLAVLAVVGGALAFKATTYNGTLKCTFDTTQPTTVCEEVTYTTIQGNTPALCKPIDAPDDQECVLSTVRFAE